MNRDITEKLLSCSVYNSTQAHQQKEPLQPHPVPVLPWSTVATDVFEWHGQQYMVLVDSYSGWFEIDLLRNTSSAAVITKLKRHFSVHGSPHTLINDNARYYTSQHFKEFAEQWDFVHVTSSTEYPQSNGPAERAVRSAKQLMERSHRDGTDVFLNLLNVRNIPHDKTLGSPAECLMSRQTRSTLPVSSRVLAPAPKNTKQVIAQHQKKRLIQKQYYDASSHPLQPLAEGQVIRMQTTKGHGYLQDLGIYRRNRRHILPVAKPPPQVDTADSDHQTAAPAEPDISPSTPQMLQALYQRAAETCSLLFCQGNIR